MKLLRQFLIISGISFLGEILKKLFHIPLPGNVIGMIILFICLCTGIVRLDMIDEISKFLLEHLAFFFIPAGVGLIMVAGLLKTSWLSILLILITTTIIVIIVTGHTVQLLKRGNKNE